MQIRYGKNSTLSLDLSQQTLVEDNVASRRSPLGDVAKAVGEALANPLDFPPLGEMVLADDKVVIALEEGVPCAPGIVAGVVSSLVSVGPPPERIRVLRAHTDRAISHKKILAEVDASLRDRIEVVQHDPENAEGLSYLASSSGDKSIYVNRELFDADVVIPVGAMTHDRIGCLGVHHGWFPTFADAETQTRFHKSQSTLSATKLEKRRKECEEAAWMLGIQMAVQLIPAGNDQAMYVLAGAPEALSRRVNELMADAWRVQVDKRVSLVVAAIGGGPEQQTWQNITRTITTALEAVETDGSIAICSKLKARPGPALRRLAQSASYEEADRSIRRKATADALAAIRLNRALQHARVYLLSELEEQDVESLGMAFVADPKEISQLSAHHRSCLVLENAQHVTLAVDGGE